MARKFLISGSTIPTYSYSNNKTGTVRQNQVCVCRFRFFLIHCQSFRFQRSKEYHNALRRNAFVLSLICNISFLLFIPNTFSRSTRLRINVLISSANSFLFFSFIDELSFILPLSVHSVTLMRKYSIHICFFFQEEFFGFIKLLFQLNKWYTIISLCRQCPNIYYALYYMQKYEHGLIKCLYFIYHFFYNVYVCYVLADQFLGLGTFLFSYFGFHTLGVSYLSSYLADPVLCT